MMSLYAPDATFTLPGSIAAGKKEIRQFWLTSKSMTNNWISETPIYKVRITVNGDRGTLYFECHYVNPKTGKVVSTTAADSDVARINGRWLITNLAGASAVSVPEAMSGAATAGAAAGRTTTAGRAITRSSEASVAFRRRSTRSCSSPSSAPPPSSSPSVF